MDTTTFALLLAIVAGGYIASAQYKYQGQFNKFCNLTDATKNKTLNCVEESYRNTSSSLLYPSKVLEEMCNKTKEHHINITVFLQNLFPKFLKRNVTAIFKGLKACLKKNARNVNQSC
ncbi:uncharacterized protein LOC144100038 [Amblyomma americanum]